MQLIPALDLLGSDAVRLQQGDYDRVIFRESIDTFLRHVLATDPPLVHVVDLEAARSGNVRAEMAQKVVAIAGETPLQFSGGIRSLDDAHTILSTGVARIIMGTAVWATDDALAAFSEALGPQLVVALDVRDGTLAVRGWRHDSALTVDEALRRCVAVGVNRLHVTAIARDGMMKGPDLDLYRTVCASGIAVVAAGGVRDEEDLAALEAIGCEGAVMGMGLLSRLGITVAIETPPTA